MTTTFRMALLALAFCVLPAASHGADEPSKDLLKALEKIEFADLKGVFAGEKVEFDAKDGTFTWTLKSKTAKPDGNAGLLWEAAMIGAQTDFSINHLGGGPRVRFWKGDDKIGTEQAPEIEDKGLGRDDHYRVKVKVKVSKEAVKTATDATYK